MRPQIVVFASGTKEGGGSGFENLVLATKRGELDADIVAVVSNHEHGGVWERAQKLKVPFIYFPGPYDAEHYSSVLQKTAIDLPWVAFSGWLRKAEGLDPRRTFNIHPALLSQFKGRFGGKEMFGKKLYEEVLRTFERGEITHSGPTMHFVTEELDQGPAFFEYRFNLKKGMSAEEIALETQRIEHAWQPKITNMIVHEEIRWDGKDPATLQVPDGYQFLPQSN